MDKKEEIVQNASTLFAEKGYYGVGLKELLDSCGVPKNIAIQKWSMEFKRTILIMIR